MKKIKKRAMAILLTVMMILSSLPMGITAVATVSSSDASSVYVVVPETIYLKASKGEATTAQYYINNTFNNSTNEITLDAVNNETTGKIYFKNTDATSVKVTVSADSDTVTVSGITSGSFYSLSSGYTNLTVNSLTLSNGVAAGSSSLIIWIFVATLSDGTTESYFAFTTVYSPYYTPVAAAAYETRTNGVAIQGVSWISGIHAIDSTYNYSVTYGTKTTVNLTYLSPLLGNLVTTAGTAASNYTGASSLSGSTYSSEYAAMYVETSNNNANAENMASSYTGTLYVDTTRNSNLNTIPNVTVGFLVSNVNKSGGTLYYYVSDFTSELTSLPSNHYNNAQGFSAQAGTDYYTYDGDIFYGSLESTYESISSGGSKLIYNGTWDKSLTSLTTNATYAVKGAARFKVSDSAYINCMSFVNVIRVYKDDLRAQIETCVESGWQENWCSDSNAWSTYLDALQEAYYYLGKPDATSTEVSNALSALTTAYSALTKKTSQTVTAYHYALNKVLNEDGNWTGKYLVSKICNNISAETYWLDSEGATVAYGQNVTLSGYSRSNYTCAGYVLSDEDNTVSLGTTLTERPDYTSTSTSATLVRSDDDYVFGKTVIFYYIGDTVTLTIDADGGDIGTCNDSVTATVGSVFSLPTPTKTGYTFTGWTLENNYGRLDETENTFTFGKYDNSITAGWEEVDTYTVTWINEDGTVLETDTDVEYGATPEYNGPTPTKAADAQYTYTFADWTPEISKVTGDVTYTATYESTVNKYKVTFANYDGNVLSEQQIEYGSSATAPADPTRDYDTTYHYTFNGWDKDYSSITADTTITATYTSKEHTCTSDVTTAATCTQDGVMSYTCSCGYSYTEEISATGHTPEVRGASDATCGNDGYTGNTVCSDCGETLSSGKTVQATGNHTYGEWKTVTEATCVDAGEKKRTCSVCRYTETAEIGINSDNHVNTELQGDKEATCGDDGYTGDTVCLDCGVTNETGTTIDATGDHTIVIDEAVEPTCKTGLTEGSHCSVCGTVIEAQETIPATFPHTYGDGVVTKQATCDEEGIMTYTCTVCGHEMTETIKALGHVDNDDDGVCNNCDENISSDSGNSSSSSSGSSSSSKGWDAFRCKMCDQYEANKDTPVIGFFYTIVHFFIHLAHYIGYLT